MGRRIWSAGRQCIVGKKRGRKESEGWWLCEHCWCLETNTCDRFPVQPIRSVGINEHPCWSSKLQKEDCIDGPLKTEFIKNLNTLM